MFNRIIVCLLMVFAMMGITHAEPGLKSTGLDLSLPDAQELQELTGDSGLSYPGYMQLAALGSPATSSAQFSGDGGKEMGEFHERWFTGAKTHKYLGLGSLGLAAIAMISPKEEDGAHENAAKASAALGIAAVATGLIYHHEDIQLNRGFKDPDNLHAFLGGLGALGIAMAASKGPEGGHAGFGIAGAIGMVMGIKYTW